MKITMMLKGGQRYVNLDDLFRALTEDADGYDRGGQQSFARALRAFRDDLMTTWESAYR